jgi:hypothetical protein
MCSSTILKLGIVRRRVVSFTLSGNGPPKPLQQEARLTPHRDCLDTAEINVSLPGIESEASSQ